MALRVVVVGDVLLCCLLSCVRLQSHTPAGGRRPSFHFDPPNDLRLIIEQFLAGDESALLVVDGNVGFDASRWSELDEVMIGMVPTGLSVERPSCTTHMARGVVFVPRRRATGLVVLDPRDLEQRLNTVGQLPGHFVRSSMVEHAFDGCVGARDLRRFR